MRNSSELPNLPHVLGVNLNGLKQHSGWSLFLGIVFMVLGLLAIILPGPFELGLEEFLGWLFIFGGVVQVAASFRFTGSKGWFISLITAILACVVGVLFIIDPFQGVRILTIVLAAYYLFDGVAKVIFHLGNTGRPGSGWGIINGIFGITIAGIVWSAWPISTAWFIGLLVGINMLFYGMALITLSSACRRHLNK